MEQNFRRRCRGNEMWCREAGSSKLIALVLARVTCNRCAVARPVILVVEDEPIILDLLCDFLTQMGYETVAAHDLDSAIAAARTTVFNAAVIDINLSGVTVFPAVDVVAAAGTPVIFASAYYGVEPPENTATFPC